jgi:IS1 family transposase/transposase-like protein
MLCQTCQSHCRRFGKNRNGSQRFRCDVCSRTFTDAVTRPVDRRCLNQEKAVLCLRMLLEGNSIRSIERLTGVHRDTIIDTMVVAGENCKRLLERNQTALTVENVEVDEVWGFVGMKEKTRERYNRPDDKGDAYCFTAIEHTNKMIICWHLGKRTSEHAHLFAEKLRQATSGRFQLSTDGYKPYQTAIPRHFGNEVDFATLVKVYGESEDQRRYSPPTVTDVVMTSRLGNPDMEKVCTSIIERHNLTLRMSIRRLTRLTNAHSKKWENHEAALALFIAYYNYARVHSTLKCTPAVKAGLTDRTWSVQELLAKAAATQS